MFPIDVHVLTHEGTDKALLAKCLDSLEAQPCNVFVVDNAGEAVGAGRAKGYIKGQAELVSYIDSDDYALPGAFAAMVEAMAVHKAVVCRELVQRDDGSFVQNPVEFHAPTCYRRSDVLKYLAAIKAASWCADALLRRALRPVQLQTIGQVRVRRAGSAASNVTLETQMREGAVWNFLTAPVR